MTELIIGKTYSMTDSRDGKKYIYEIQDKNFKYYKVKGRYDCSYMIDISLYNNIEELENELENNIGNVVKYILRAGIKYPSIEDKIKDLKKAIWYLGREIDNLEKEKNNG